MQKRVVRTLTLALSLTAVALPALSQTATPANADLGYSLTKTGWGSADRITQPGTVYVFRIEGMLARAIADHITPTNVITDGKLIPPAKGFIHAFGAGGDSQQISPGDRFYLHDIDKKDDGVVFTFISLDKSKVVQKGNSTSSRLRMYVKFPMTADQLTTVTPDSLHHLTDAIFLPEGSPALTPTVQLGQSLGEVHQIMGDPLKQVDLGPKTILVYKDLKVTLVDNKVTDAE